mgnify:CR=1 FL=1
MARIRELAGLPIEQHNSPNTGGRMSDHRGIVLHIAEGTYRGTISWHMNPDQRYGDGTKVTTSSTWVVGKNHGEWAQMVDTDTVAWCQRSGSHTWLSIELAGYSGDKPSAWQVEACAQLLAWAHKHYGVPLAVADTDAKRGLGHHSMDREWAGVEWGHEDCPGKGVIAAKPAIVARAKEIIEEDDMPTAKEIAQAVWNTDNIVPAPWPVRTDDNPYWATGTTLHHGLGHAIEANRRIAELAVKVDGMVTIIATLADALKAGGSLDTAAVLAKLDGLAKQVAQLSAERDELNRKLAAAYGA